MAAPIRKVTPSAFINAPAFVAKEAALGAPVVAETPSIHASIGTLGTVLSSTVPGVLGISAQARHELRRLRGLH